MADGMALYGVNVLDPSDSIADLYARRIAVYEPPDDLPAPVSVWI